MHKQVVTRILFICHGNICRSPMAEFVMKQLVSEAGLAEKFYIESAATSWEEIGNPIYPPAKAKLREHGVPFGAEKRAQPLKAAHYQDFDLLIGMDAANIRNTRRFFGGDGAGKVHLLLDYAGRPGQEVADPWYSGDFEAAYRDIMAGCRGLLDILQKGIMRDEI